MTKRKIIEDFIEESKLKHGEDTYGYDRCLIYVNNKTKVELYCYKHKEYFSVTPNDHLGKKLCGCPKCGLEKRKPSLVPRTFEEFVTKAREVHGDRYIYHNTKDSYPVDGYVDIECPVHGMFSKIINDHLRSRKGGGCQRCFYESKRLSRDTLNNYIGKASEYFNNRYDYSLIDLDSIKSTTQKVPIICPVHGEYLQGFDSHFILLQNCNKCSKSYSEEDVISIIKERSHTHINTDEIYLEYNSNFVRDCIIKNLYCAEHDVYFNQTYNAFLDGFVGCPSCSSRSKNEIEIFNFIKSLIPDEEVLVRYKPDWMDRKELDIFVPSKNLAIEYNGSAFHHSSHDHPVKYFSERSVDSSYHFNKWKKCFDNGVTLLSIYDFVWKNKQKLIESKIKHLLELDCKVYARNTVKKDIDNSLAKEFYENNHLESSGILYKDSKSYGLYYEDTLIMCCTFSNTYNQNKKTKNLKLHRICTLQGVTVVGGISKLLKGFDNFKYQITLSTGGSTLKHFNNYRLISPRYFWVNPSNLEYFSRNYTQKQVLEKHFNEPLLDSDTENSYMERLGYIKVFDNGLAEINISK